MFLEKWAQVVWILLVLGLLVRVLGWELTLDVGILIATNIFVLLPQLMVQEPEFQLALREVDLVLEIVGEPDFGVSTF